MAIFRVTSYSTITVGSGGRITIPQDRQITIWKTTAGELR
jgi:hypothetical protein